MCRACMSSLLTDHLASGVWRGAPSRRRFLAYAVSAGAAAMAATGEAGAAGGAEVIFHNGSIIPMTVGQRPVEALAIGGGKILAVGSLSDVSAIAHGTTRIVDLKGRALLPGFIDPHHHTVLSAVLAHLLLDIGYVNYTKRAEAIAALTAEAAKTPQGRWIAAGYFDNLLQGGDLSMKELDAISTQHPILVMYVNGHVAAANAIAFERAKIPEDVGELPGGGHFGRGPDDKLNGLIYEEPALLRFLGAAVPPMTPELIAKSLVSYTKQAAAAGNTTLHEPGTVKPEWVEPLAKLSNTLDARLSASFSTDAVEASKAFASLGPRAKARKIAGSRFSLYGMKFWADGSNQAEMAAQTRPYLNTTNKGRTNYSASQMAQICRTARDAGWPILIHCQGDAAVDDALDAIEEAYGANPATGLNRVEHATMARQDQFERMKRLGVEPSFIPDFLYLYGAAYRDQIFGAARANFMVPAGAAAKAGVLFTLHSDSPAAGMPINPLRHVQTAVTRRCAIDNSVVGPDLAITIDQAMRAITVHAARQIGLEDTIGTLEPGKEADLTILDSDPYKASPDVIAHIPVSETWVAGERKFAA
jgi:predicted amidohydrolase YtcJ